MEVKIELLGADRFIARLGRASDRIGPETLDGLNQVADRIVEDAKATVRVDTGSLQRSIRKQHHVSQGHIHSIGVSAGGYMVNPKTGRIVDYARYLEYGTSRMPPQPYMTPALEQNRPFLVLVLRDRLRVSMQ
ncbi:MAG: HK97 gp10 family phage protein [Candidatus Bathyarchaeota archaeon]|nr:HK97 gp10 family phage protein [Candidatus Bathyarchaeota archaeon]MDH5686506.1 HK97 gp10 family phage protein [Candidatus Bathyarchaeota archaeon]